MTMKYTKTVTIDMATDYSNTITAKQNDSARTVLVTLVNKGEVYQLPSSSVKFYALKPDGTRVFNDVLSIDVKNGTVEVKLTSQTLAEVGKVRCELAFYEGTNILTTVCFNIKVEQGVRSDSAVESTDDFSALTSAISTLDTWNDYFEETSGQIETKYTDRLTQAETDIDTLETNLNTKLSLSGNTESTPLAGDLVLANKKYIRELDKDGVLRTITVIDENNNFYLGDGNLTTTLRSSDNPIIKIADNDYTMYHTGNTNASKIGANTTLFNANFGSITNGWLSETASTNLNYNSCVAITNGKLTFTAPTDGKYIIRGGVTTTGESSIYYYKNDSTLSTLFELSSAMKCGYEVELTLSANDTITFYSTSANAFTINSMTIEKLNGGI